MADRYMMLNHSEQLPLAGWRFFIASLLLIGLLPAVTAVAAPTADHSQFEVLQFPFSDIEQINTACVACHNVAQDQLHKTIHWRWDTTLENGAEYGKLNVINAYHPNVASNSSACGSCHIGFGLAKKLTDGIAPAAVDCLACHDTSGEYFYFRFHQDGAECAMCHDDGAAAMKQRVKEQGEKYSLSLAAMAQSTGATTAATCGSCHFYDGGADGAKHGDLDSSLIQPEFALDVHMSADGANFSCSSCHQSVDHQLFGSRYEAHSVGDDQGVSALTGARATCVSCHGDRPMQDDKLNDHTDVIACQTCHIPTYARGGVATKTLWDWSTAGELSRSKRPKVELNEAGRVSYASQKGNMEYGENLKPVYRWFNGDMVFKAPGADVNAEGVTLINEIQGSSRDGISKIFPFHQITSILPYDTQSDQLMPINLVGRSRDAYWNGYDWKKSLKAGAKAAGVEFSGDFDFTETQMSWALNHMVAPKEQALSCNACHGKGSVGLLDDVEGLYIPGRLQHSWLDHYGVLALILTFLGVAGHGALRAYFGWRRKQQ
jgi:octaheme c-type cytochrome (tetrathionate reductase family)